MQVCVCILVEFLTAVLWWAWGNEAMLKMFSVFMYLLQLAIPVASSLSCIFLTCVERASLIYNVPWLPNNQGPFGMTARGIRFWQPRITYTITMCTSEHSVLNVDELEAWEKSQWSLRDALGKVLLGNHGSYHPRGWYFDTSHLP